MDDWGYPMVRKTTISITHETVPETVAISWNSIHVLPSPMLIIDGQIHMLAEKNCHSWWLKLNQRLATVQSLSLLVKSHFLLVKSLLLLFE